MFSIFNEKILIFPEIVSADRSLEVKILNNPFGDPSLEVKENFRLINILLTVNGDIFEVLHLFFDWQVNLENGPTTLAFLEFQFTAEFLNDGVTTC